MQMKAINGRLRGLLAALFFLVCFSSAVAGDERSVSLLTCSPGEEVYALFGHTALRVTDPERGMDVVFNYGLFSFDEPNFIWRFVLGETDYLLGAIDYDFFLGEYAIRGSGVTEQVLNLDSLQKNELINALVINASPKYRSYRYNFLFNNCTTKARDKILEILGGKNAITYDVASVGDSATFRDIVHRFTEHNEWYRLGMDLLLGAPADVVAGRDGAQFAPLIFKEDLSHAYIGNVEDSRPLVVRNNELLLPVSRDAVRNNLTPFNTSLLLLLFTFVVMLCERRSKKTYWVWDVFMFALQGIAGCLLTFMVLFSQHPAVDTNWLLIWLNPIPLFLLPIFIYRVIKGKTLLFLWIEIVMVLLFFILSPFLPQYFPVPLYLCGIALIVRSLFNIYKNKICALD